jgi:hypothetical protein
MFNLVDLDLSYNFFSGSLPTNIGGLIGLQSFSADGNQFSGSLPSEVGQMIDLRKFEICTWNFEEIRI